MADKSEWPKLNKTILTDSKEWRMSASTAFQKLDIDEFRIKKTKELLEQFIPWITKYKKNVNIGYELADTYHTFISIMFRDLNLYSEAGVRVLHLRLGRDYEGMYTYYLEMKGKFKVDVSDSGLNKFATFEKLLKALAEEFDEVGIYTEDELTVRDIIT